MTKYNKEYYEANKEQYKAYSKAYYEANKESIKASKKAYQKANKEHYSDYQKAYKQANKDKCNAYSKAYHKANLNALGQTKNSIRQKSRSILKQMNLHIPGYEIHHCFGYDDPSKFIYISKALHLKIHQLLRDKNIEADSNHWMTIRDLVNSTDEFWYIKC